MARRIETAPQWQVVFQLIFIRRFNIGLLPVPPHIYLFNKTLLLRHKCHFLKNGADVFSFLGLNHPACLIIGPVKPKDAVLQDSSYIRLSRLWSKFLEFMAG
ncbi:hypothetical protein CPA46_01810 [Sphingopyxis terrae subsp. ummariensis]|nr:hypothetical protein CPA46_01810 [Sphingopyxis terrae subsp. ummariensis]